ncbi:MAG: toll/interleukin-1 receptor domain-containing protein, partial [Pseudomonadota bacterium]
MTDTSAPGQRLRQATWDFFVSRAGADSEIAIWIAGLIAAQGAKVLLQDNDFGHQDFMGAMHTGLQDGAPVVALLSPAYLASDFCISEATGALTGDPLNKRQRLKPLRIDHCAPTGMLANIAYTDLVPERRFNDATALAEKILRAVGFETFTLEGVPPPPAGTLSKKIQIRHPDIRENRTFAGREEMLALLAER